MYKHLLAVLALLPISFFNAQAQIIKGLSYRKTYTVERLAEIHADKELEVKEIYKGKRIEIRLSEDGKKYMLVELNNYNELKGGVLDRIMLVGVQYDEADRLFQQWLDKYGEPDRGYIEECNFSNAVKQGMTGVNKGAVFYNKFVSGDVMAVRMRAEDMMYKNTYTFEVNSSMDKTSLGNLGNPEAESSALAFMNWRITKVYGRGPRVKY